MSDSILRHLKQRKPFGSLEQEVFVGLRLASTRLVEPWECYLKEEADLTEVQYNVLRILRGAGDEGLRAQELGGRLISRSPDVTRLVTRLEARGLVDRCVDPVDARAVRVRITDAGLARLAPLDAVAERMLRSLMSPLSRERLESLRDALGELLDAVQPMSTKYDEKECA